MFGGYVWVGTCHNMVCGFFVRMLMGHETF